jgi:threonine aldolase
MAQQRKLEELVGRAEQELVRKGTGSEHVAIVLHTTSGERVVLQRQAGNPFEDEETRGLAGRTVRVEGYRLGDVFRFTRVVTK